MSSRSIISLLSTASSLLLATTTPVADAAVGITISTATCDGDPFTDLNLDIYCTQSNNAPDCLFGDTATIDGQVEAIADFENANLTLKACIGWYCPEENIRSAGSLCDDWLTPVDENVTCGEAGLYNVSNYELIPEADIPDSWSWLLKVSIGIDQECEASGDTEEIVTNANPYYGMTYSMLGALIGTAFGISYAAKQRLICNGEDLDEEYYDDDDTAGGTFVEMRDGICAGAEVV